MDTTQFKLNTPVIAHLNVNPGPAMLARYEVRLNSETIFVGKTYIKESKMIGGNYAPRSINIVISDILRDYRYDYSRLLKPIYTINGITFPNLNRSIPVIYTGVVEVVIEGDEQNKFQTDVLFEYTEADQKKIYNADYMTLYSPLETIAPDAYPHIPAVKGNYYLGVLVLQDKAQGAPIDITLGDKVIKLEDRQYQQVTNAGGYYPITANLTELGDLSQMEKVTCKSQSGEIIVAMVDKCPADYYLCWAVDGCWFSYGFTGRATKRQQIEHIRVTDITEQTNNVVSISQRSLILNSGIVDKSYYYPFERLYASKYVGLYDVRNDQFRYVNVEDTQIEYKLNGKELKNFTVTVADRNKMII